MPPLRNRPTYAEIMAARKRADSYIRRDGTAPDMGSRKRDGRKQDLNDDDRKHLAFCLKTLDKAVARNAEAEACLEFVVALVESVYGAGPEKDRPQDRSRFVSADEDPDLYRSLTGKRPMPS